MARGKLGGGSTPKARKPRQAKLPGTEPAEHPDVVNAAEAYVEVRDQRCEMSKRESERAGVLLAAMKKHGLSTYALEDGSRVEVVPGADKVKVRKPRDEAEDDE